MNNPTFTNKINIYKSLSGVYDAGKMTKINGGIYKSAFITYPNLTKPGIYKKSIENKYPVNTYTLPLSVMSNIKADDGVSEQDITRSYKYCGDIMPHAVMEVDNTDGVIPSGKLNTYFNDFGMIETINSEVDNLQMHFEYGPGQERWYSVVSHYGINANPDTRTTLYAGDYEKITEGGVTREFYYLDGSTIIIKENGQFKPYLAFTDNLGSILSVVDENGTVVFNASYDAWGRQTVTKNSIGLHRGYTGHEMLNEFDIINMNGRLYDPVLGRFFSPDNYVQMPDNSQSFNRYSYCLNNPLKYTDPSGDNFIIAFALFNMAKSMMMASINGENVWKAGGLSLLSSAATYGIGELFGATGNLGHELLRASTHGLADGGFAAWATGGDFLQGAMQGMRIGVLNHAMHDNNDIMGTSAICERQNDGIYLAPHDMDDVVVLGINLLPRYPIEKPLESVYPEFGVFFAGRAIINSAIKTTWSIGKESVNKFRTYISSNTGETANWIRYHDNYSRSGGFKTKSLTWGSNNYHRQNIRNNTLRNLNEAIRDSRIPMNSWRTADKGHLHLKWQNNDTREWFWLRK